MSALPQQFNSFALFQVEARARNLLVIHEHWDIWPLFADLATRGLVAECLRHECEDCKPYAAIPQWMELVLHANKATYWPAKQGTRPKRAARWVKMLTSDAELRSAIIAAETLKTGAAKELLEAEDRARRAARRAGMR